MSSNTLNGGDVVNGDGTLGREKNCYFCNELFQLGHLQAHLKHCGSILEQCPLRCGAWIQRKHRDAHVQECPRTNTRTSIAGTHARAIDPAPNTTSNVQVKTKHTWSPSTVPVADCVAVLEKEISDLRLHLSEESGTRQIQATELDTVNAKLVLLEDRTQHFVTTLVALTSAIDSESERTTNLSAQFNNDLTGVQLALQDLQSQQLQTAMKLESVTASLVHEQNERELLEQALTQHDNRIRAVNRLESTIQYIKQAVEEEREKNLQSRAVLEAELHEARRSSQQLHQLSELRVELQSHANNERPALDRLSILEVATADARAENSEHALRIDSLSRDLRALTKSYLKLRSELADFQSKVSFDNAELGGDDGHMIWRIDNFTSRMKDAKDHDTVISSPLFRTHKYGYTLKAEMNLNGIGKWKGRHITATVRLVGSPYDALLEWPCDLNINIVLKDQATNRKQAVDIVKSLQLRRKSSSRRHDYDDADDKNKSNEALDRSLTQIKRQYVFIPHTSLDKFDYIKNDVAFIEFVVNH